MWCPQRRSQNATPNWSENDILAFEHVETWRDRYVAKRGVTAMLLRGVAVTLLCGLSASLLRGVIATLLRVMCATVRVRSSEERGTRDSGIVGGYALT